MRHVFLIGELPSWTTASAVEEAIRRNLDARDDVKASPNVLIKGTRVNVVGIPEHVADDLRKWFAEKLRTGDFTG